MTADHIIEKIREALEAGPTPGPWNSYSLPESNTQGPSVGSVVGPPAITRDRSSWFRPEDAAYIAACNPQDIAVLIQSHEDFKADYFRRHKDSVDHLERALVAEAERDALRTALEDMRPHIDKLSRCVRINDEMGRVVIGQTEAITALAEIHARTLAGDNHE